MAVPTELTPLHKHENWQHEPRFQTVNRSNSNRGYYQNYKVTQTAADKYQSTDNEYETYHDYNSPRTTNFNNGNANWTNINNVNSNKLHSNYGTTITGPLERDSQLYQNRVNYLMHNSVDNRKNEISDYDGSFLQNLWHNIKAVYNNLSAYFWRLVIFLAVLVFLLMMIKNLFFNRSSFTLTSTANKNRFNHNPTTKEAFLPNIIWIMADDVGHGDLSYNGAEISTNNIDYLANQGVILTQHYSQPLGAPTRAAWMTGRYPFRMGLQSATTDGNIMLPSTTVHLPVEHETIAEKLKENGYKTFAFGKWNLGYSSDKYTPLSRGFDGHIGFYQSEIDYYDRTASVEISESNTISGYDWYKDGQILKSDTKNNNNNKQDYSTYELITAIENQIKEHSLNYLNQDVPLYLQISLQNPHLPLEVPSSFHGFKCSTIHDSVRKEYCKSVQMLDYAVGAIVTSLMKHHLWEDSILVFTSDNGAVVPDSCSTSSEKSAGTNYPYRGEKGQIFEGGVLTPSFVTGPRIPVSARGHKSSVLMHAVDWVPTLMHHIQDSTFKSSVDGFDLWDSIIYPTIKPNTNQRTVVPINIDILNDGYTSDDSVFSVNGKYINTAIRNGQYKLVLNVEKLEDCDVTSPKPRKYPFSSSLKTPTMYDLDNMFLFDLLNDPYETVDLLNGKGKRSSNYEEYASVIEEFESLIDDYVNNGFESLQNSKFYSDGLATKHGGSWKPWK